MRIIFNNGPLVLTLENSQEVHRGMPAEVPDDIAIKLINQKTFELVPAVLEAAEEKASEE
jgi:hypothetical protein